MNKFFLEEIKGLFGRKMFLLSSRIELRKIRLAIKFQKSIFTFFKIFKNKKIIVFTFPLEVTHKK